MSGVEFLPQREMPASESYPHAAPAPAPAQAAVDEPLPAPARRNAWFAWLPRSITSRLVVGVVTLVVVLVLAIGASTYLALRSFLYTRLDQQLASVEQANTTHITGCLAFGPPRRCSLGAPGSYRAVATEWLMVIDSQAQDLISFDSNNAYRELQLSADQRRSILTNPQDAETVTTVDGAHLRISAQPLDLPTGHFVVISGLSTGEVTNTLRRLVTVELIIGTGAVLLAFAATSWGVRRSLRNLYQVTGTAQEVAAELSPSGTGLDRRVPVMEEGTEVGQLAESMNTLLAAVETQFAARVESENRMRQFLADASHELRTPLTSIRGFAELARMQRAAGDTEQDNLDRIESEGTRMSRLIEDLLLLARGDSEDAALAMHRELVDVPDVVDDAVSGARAAFPDRSVDVALGPVPPVVGDHDQLVRVVRNLINNAAVHTEAGRPIQVRTFADPDGAVLTVSDGGPGLPPEQAAHVFERFWRADKARTRARGGTGLGLSIVAAIVRAHGGTVRFDSTVETGSTVTVRLPAAE